MENIGNQLLRWQKLIQRTANKVRSIKKTLHFNKYLGTNTRSCKKYAKCHPETHSKEA